jgi:tetratricopeptide (TPR) repeat protein
MDQLSAHLDRGWDLAQKGDAAGASACAKRALELDPQSPEVHNLLGYSAALAGESEEALEHYKQAIALDETYLEAMLNAAEVLMHPLADYEEAVGYCNDALDYAETTEEIADCVLLKVDALLGKGDTEGAKKAMSEVPDGPFENPSYLFLVGRAFYEVGQPEKAGPLLDEAVRRDPMHADAHYYIGLLREEARDTRGAVEAFLRARVLDLVKAPPSWAPSPDAFGAMVKASLHKLDAVLASYVREADVYILDVPGAELVVDGIDPRALAIIVDARGADGDAPPRARVFVYQRNVERAAGSPEALEDELSRALEREITTVFLERDPDVQRDKGQLN